METPAQLRQRFTAYPLGFKRTYGTYVTQSLVAEYGHTPGCRRCEDSKHHRQPRGGTHRAVSPEDLPALGRPQPRHLCGSRQEAIRSGRGGDQSAGEEDPDPRSRGSEGSQHEARGGGGS